ncbi:MFS efflux pump atnC [Hyphodiscus hymeniophilus]|uniref:MFS efflux pump atnC n=1 Tax=Hyphodiscus hymeniophilus TaxID=353542 RepID=A0A9P6VSC8_9HELO|nr:MFS efflux pump atnC [Hyphodiscus hymeniophilus]
MQEKLTTNEKFVIPREVYVCAVVEFLTTFGTAITSVPVTRLIEGAVCQRHYGAVSNIAEHFCKLDGVQTNLAYLLGAYSSFTSLPGLFLAIPYGILSEHVDRRLILLGNSLSSILQNIFLVAICTIPHSNLRLIWLCGFFEIIGGGAAIHSMLIRTIIGEAVPASCLSTLLYKMSGINLLLQLAGVSLGSWLLQNGAASTTLLGTCLFGLIIPTLSYLPRTGAKATKACSDDDPIQFPYLKLEQQCQENTQTSPRHGATYSHKKSLKEEILISLKSLASLLLRKQAVQMCLLVNFLNHIAFNARYLLRPWISKRYGWSLAKTGYILSLEASLSVAVLLLLQYFDPASSDPAEKRKCEISVAKLSMLCGILGSIILCFANTRILFFVAYIVISGNVGFLDAIRGYFSAQMRTEDLGKLYSMVMIVSTLATILSAPAWSAIYALGYGLGGSWVGLPFLVSSGVMSLILLVIATLKV